MRWERIDRHRAATRWALAGLAIGGLLAAFGLPPVDLHGPLHRFGIMDPLCGGTRGLRYTLLGDWRLAWAYNPASPLLAAGAALAAVRHLVGSVSGRWLTIRLPRRRVLYLLAGLVIAALEVNQQLHAPLLTGP